MKLLPLHRLSPDSHVPVQGPSSHLRGCRLLVGPCVFWSAIASFLLLCFIIFCAAPSPERNVTMSSTVVNAALAVRSSPNMPPMVFAQRNISYRRCQPPRAIITYCARSQTRSREKTICVLFSTTDSRALCPLFASRLVPT